MNLTLKASRIWLQNFHSTGETDSCRAQTKSCAEQDPGEKSSDPTRDWARLVGECSGVSSGGMDSSQGHWIQQFREPLHAGISPVEGGHHCHNYPYHSLATCQTTGREHIPTHQQKIGLKIYWAWSTPHSKTQLSPQSIPHIRKLPQASYLHPSEGRQNENHNHSTLTKLITWVTALSNPMKLLAMPSRVSQEVRVVVENSDKIWSTGEGNGKPLHHSCLENPINSMKRQKRRLKAK